MKMKEGDLVLCTDSFIEESEDNLQFTGCCKIVFVTTYGYHIKKESISTFCNFDDVIPYSELWEVYQKFGMNITAGLNEKKYKEYKVFPTGYKPTTIRVFEDEFSIHIEFLDQLVIDEFGEKKVIIKFENERAIFPTALTLEFQSTYLPKIWEEYLRLKNDQKDELG